MKYHQWLMKFKKIYQKLFLNLFLHTFGEHKNNQQFYKAKLFNYKLSTLKHFFDKKTKYPRFVTKKKYL